MISSITSRALGSVSVDGCDFVGSLSIFLMLYSAVVFVGMLPSSGFGLSGVCLLVSVDGCLLGCFCGFGLFCWTQFCIFCAALFCIFWTQFCILPELCCL